MEPIKHDIFTFCRRGSLNIFAIVSIVFEDPIKRRIDSVDFPTYLISDFEGFYTAIKRKISEES